MHNQDPTTAELLEKWKKLKERKRPLEGFVKAYGFPHDKINLDHTVSRLQLVATELDKRCRDAGILIAPDMVIFTKGFIAVTSCCVVLPPSEVYALLGWLLTRQTSGD